MKREINLAHLVSLFESCPQFLQLEKDLQEIKKSQLTLLEYYNGKEGRYSFQKKMAYTPRGVCCCVYTHTCTHSPCVTITIEPKIYVAK